MLKSKKIIEEQNQQMIISEIKSTENKEKSDLMENMELPRLCRQNPV